MAFSGTVTATGTVGLSNGTATAAQAPCNVRLDGSDIGFNSNQVAANGIGEVAVVGAASGVSAGSHTVSVTCHSGLNSTSLSVFEARLDALALGA